ncbi:MAG: N-acetylmuramoyl-L-alanine amidase [Bacillota bacterium]
MKKLVLLSLVLTYITLCTGQGFSAGHNYSGYLAEPTNARVGVSGKIIELERDPVIIGGRMVVPARTTFENLGIRTDWEDSSNVVKMVKDNTVITMSIGHKDVFVNSIEKNMEAPPILVNGTVMVPLRFVAQTFGSRVGWDGKNGVAYIGDRPQVISRGGSASRKFKVVIDAGHGGRDPGATYGGIKEKNLNIDIARRLNGLLKEEGITTYMTRTGDSFIGLYSRSGLANRVNADLLVSVHNNAGYRRYSGSMTLYYPSSSKTRGNLSSWDFAAIVQRNLSEELGSKDLGIIPRSNLAVLRTAKMPSVIAEVGYMTNENDLRRLKTSSYKQKAAEALKNAVLESLDKMY